MSLLCHHHHQQCLNQVIILYSIFLTVQDFPLDINSQSTTTLAITVGASFTTLILITIIAVIIIITIRYFCCVKNKGQPSSTHQTHSNNPIFDDNVLATMTYVDPPLYYIENINDDNHLTSPTSHGHNPVAISEEIGTNITSLNATYETVRSDITTSSEHYYYNSRPQNDSTAVYTVPNRQSKSSTNMGDISLEQSIELSDNVAYNVFTKQSADYLTVL